jgi:hypothetical protein
MLITIHSDRIQHWCRCHDSRPNDSRFVLVDVRHMTFQFNVKHIWVTTEVPITEQSEVKLQITIRCTLLKIKFVIMHVNWFRNTSFEH